jgi:hypothetical protein
LRRRPENACFDAPDTKAPERPANPASDLQVRLHPGATVRSPLIAGKRRGAIHKPAAHGISRDMQNAAWARCFYDKHFGYCTLYRWTKPPTSAISKSKDLEP